MNLLSIGNMVEVIGSHHSLLNPGDCGVISDIFDDGYGVRFVDRTIFLSFSEVKTPEAKLQDPKLFAMLQTLQAKIQDDINARTKLIPTRN